MKRECASFTDMIGSFADDDRTRILSALETAAADSTGPASILTDLGLDADAIIAAILFSGCQKQPPEKTGGLFGATAAALVKGVNKINSLITTNNSLHEAKNIRNMLFALAGDIREIVILLAAKLHKLRELDSLGMQPGLEEERKTSAQECLDIFAPLADRLGISRIKDEMEDISLKFLNREAYQQIKDVVAERLDRRNQFLAGVQQAIKKETDAAGITTEVICRAKHFYSVYMKMRKRGISLGKMYDLSGLRIICGSIENCYTILGIIYNLWKPVAGTFKDYIARPKPNGYQSLHTSVTVEQAGCDAGSSAEGRLLEIQIRTREMHHVAENGVASHWLYKKGSSRDMVNQNDINIINKLGNWKQGKNDSQYFTGDWLDGIRQEILRDFVYVFTPQGKVIELPAGATAVDFAYSIHTAIGDHCIGAKAGGSIIPLNSPLRNTQVVEIQTSPSAHPHLNWMQYAKTAKARNKIRSWLAHNDSSFLADKSAETEKPVLPPHAAKPETEAPESKNDLLAQRVFRPAAGVLRVTVEDEKNLMVRFARCCNPVTGDKIIGYVSRGRGIIIHRNTCSNLSNIPEFNERKMEAEWEHADSVTVKRFRIEARSSENIFSEIESTIRRRGGHLIEGRLEESAANRLTGAFTMQLEKAADMRPLIANIRGIPGIISIQAVS